MNAKSTKKAEISLSDFISFVNKTGNAKMTKVKQLKNRDDYEPFSDFYKPLREKIQQIHKTGKERKELDTILPSLSDPKKINSYPPLIDGYKKWWGKKKISFFVPPSKKWKVGEIEIRINPELGLEYNSQFHVVKLFFKDEKINKQQIDQILTLMEYELRSKVNEPEIKFALLDVRKSRLYIKKDNNLAELPLLLGEAQSFETIWKHIQ